MGNLQNERDAEQEWADNLLRQFGAVYDCDTHGYAVGSSDEEALEKAVRSGRAAPYGGRHPDEAEALLRKARRATPDFCPGCSAVSK